MPILVFLGFSVLELGPMYVTDRRQTMKASLNAPPIRGRGIIIIYEIYVALYGRNFRGAGGSWISVQ